MPDPPLDICVLGYRFMDRAHANALAQLPMFFGDAPPVNPSLIVGRDEQALDTAATQFGFDRYSTDWRDIVADCDVFYNLDPNHIHREPTVAALEAGIPTLCEKLLAPTVADAEAMVEAAAATDAHAGIAFNYRFVPALQYAKQVIKPGELGRLRHFRGRYLQDCLVDPETPWSWRTDADLAGSGALGDLGTHTVDLARFLVGDISRVSGHLTTFIDERPVAGADATKAVTVDDAYSAHIQFDTGAVGTLEGTRMANGRKNDHTIEIEGTAGSLRISLERLNEPEILRDGSRGYETVLMTAPSDPYLDHWLPPGHVLGWELSFDYPS